jgi:hypothetical protein
MSENGKNIKIDNWRIYDFPIKYSEADYQEVRNVLIDKAKKTPGLIALFEYGCIPVPGISDMDFWAVFSDDAETMHIPASPVLSLKTRHLMMHKVTVISEKHYRKLLYFDPWATYAWPNGNRLLYQKKDIKRDLNFEKMNFNKEQRNILSAARIEESLGAIYSVIPFYAKKELPVRKIFEVIKDCVYIMEEINIITSNNISNSFSEKFKELRKNWFKLEQKKAIRELIDILHQGLLISYEAAFSLSDWMNKKCQFIHIKDLGIHKTNFFNNSFLDKKYKNIYLNTFKDRRIFTNFVKSPKQSLELSIKSYKKIKINFGAKSKLIDFYIIFQPLGMANFLLSFISEYGLLSNNLRKDIFSNKENLPVFKPKIFQEKIKMINEITEIYNKKQRKNSDGKGFLFGNNRFGYLFEKEKLRRKFLTLYIKRKFWQTINQLN